MSTTLNIAGLVCGIVGSALWFCDGYRISQMFTADSFSLGYGKRFDHWFWRYCGRVGIGLVGIGFALQLLVYFV